MHRRPRVDELGRCMRPKDPVALEAEGLLVLLEGASFSTVLPNMFLGRDVLNSEGRAPQAREGPEPVGTTR